MKKTIRKKMEQKEKLLLSVIRENQPISRTKLNRITNIRLGTITELVRNLKEDGFIVEKGTEKSLRGRKQSLLRINGERYFALGLEFDAEKIIALLIDLNSQIRKESEAEIGEDKGRESIIKKIASVVFSLCEGIPSEKLLGLGIADPGVVDSKEGISLFSSLIPNWENVPLGTVLNQELKIPVRLIAAPKAKAIAEFRLGAGKGIDDLLFIEFGPGIACGIINKGKLFHGHNGMAGELGHTHVSDNGTICGCGSYGCLEAIAAMPAIIRKIKESIKAGSESLIKNSEDEEITPLQIFQAADKGDKLCLNILSKTVHYLGLGIANAINLFNPEMVIFDKRMALSGGFFLEEIGQVIRRQTLRFATASLKFAVSPLGEEAGPLGAATLILDEFFQTGLVRHFSEEENG
ncbi:MAG: ROK family protein [Candidatus Latescibacteria bacterium]|nr:ROK family protein [Candidatus Latescibacterota bacterium]